MKRPPRVSVLMATYNYGAFLPAAVESVLTQELSDFELIISDNASTDDTEEIARRYARQDSRVKYFRNPSNVGLAANFNLCHRRADPASSYLIGLPADDWWAPTLLKELVGAAERHPQVVVVHCDGYRVDHESGAVLNRYTELFRHLPPAGVHRSLSELYKNNYIPFQGALVRRALAAQLYPGEALFREEIPYTNDYHLWLQLLNRGGYAYYHPEPLAYILKHEHAHTVERNIVPRLQQEMKTFGALAEVCPPAFEQDRLAALGRRRSALAFALLRLGRASEAKVLLEEAVQEQPPRRLDVTVARLIARLPASAPVRAGLWQLALATYQAARRGG